MVGSVENSQVMTLVCDLEKITMVKVLKFGTLFSFFSQKMLVIRAGIQKMLVRIVNRDNPDQTASSEAVRSGSVLFVLALLAGE